MSGAMKKPKTNDQFQQRLLAALVEKEGREFRECKDVRELIKRCYGISAPPFQEIVNLNGSGIL